MSERKVKGKADAYLLKLKEWEYCYCKNCKVVRYVDELEATSQGIKCLTCSSFDIDPPAWASIIRRRCTL